MNVDYNTETQEITVELNTPAIEFDTPTGGRGLKGETGSTGPQGPQGIQGEKGDKGDTGEDGYTPIKGVDYFTAEDIASLNIPTKTSDITNDSGYITSSSLPTKVSDLTNDTGFITNTVNNLTNYYTSTNTYTKSEVDSLIGAVSSLDIEVVQTLPTHDISTSTIYLVPKTGTTNDVYDEYIYVSNSWELIGSTQVDLSNYYTKTETDTLLGNKQDTLVSGTNIKTINNTSLLGSGNIDVSGGGGTPTDVKINGTSITSNNEADIQTKGAYNASTNKIATIGDVPKVYYGTSSTSASTAAKVVTCSGFVKETGAIIFVKFTNGNSYNGTATLNVNSTNASDIATVGDTKTSRYYWKSGEIVGFIYDGTNYVMIEQGSATTTYYGVTKLSSSTSSTSESVAATPKAVKAAYDLANGKQNAITSSNKLDYSLIDNTPTIPTKVSDLTNDSGFITGYTETDPVFTASAAHGISSSDITNWNGKMDYTEITGNVRVWDLDEGAYVTNGDCVLYYYGASDTTNSKQISVGSIILIADASLTRRSGFSKQFLVVSGATGVKTLAGYSTSTAGYCYTLLSDGDIANNLTTTTAGSVLDASQGKALKDLIDGLATVATTGSYNDLSNKPTIPTVPTTLSSFTDDLGSSPTHTHSQYLTSFTETDPVYSASAAAGITSSDISNWDNKSNLELIKTNYGTSSNPFVFEDNEPGIYILSYTKSDNKYYSYTKATSSSMATSGQSQLLFYHTKYSSNLSYGTEIAYERYTSSDGTVRFITFNKSDNGIYTTSNIVSTMALASSVGTLSNLTTTTKTDLVSAINETNIPKLFYTTNGSASSTPFIFNDMALGIYRIADGNSSNYVYFKGTSSDSATSGNSFGYKILYYFKHYSEAQNDEIIAFMEGVDSSGDCRKNNIIKDTSQNSGIKSSNTTYASLAKSSTVGTLSSLTTTDKSDLVSAINEVKGDIPTVPTNVSSFTNDAGYLTSVPVSDVKVNNTSILSSGIADLTTNTAYDSTTNKLATMADIPAAVSPNIMTVYLDADFAITNTNTAYDLLNTAVSSSVGSKLTFSNGKIVIGAGVSKVKVSYTAKTMSSANTTRTFTYLMQDINGVATAISQEGYWYGATNWQVVNTYGPITLNVNQGDAFYLRCYGYKNNVIAGAASTFLPTILTVEVIE